MSFDLNFVKVAYNLRNIYLKFVFYTIIRIADDRGRQNSIFERTES